MARIDPSNGTHEDMQTMSVTIMILNWNSETALTKCLLSLSKQSTQLDQVIVINNGPKSEMINGLKARWSQLNLIVEQLDINKGFAIANNMGARLAHGKWIALL